MSKEHAYAYEAGYRDGSINYELEHCPACKNVADLQEALAENAKLRERITELEELLPESKRWFSADTVEAYVAEIAKLRELARDMYERFYGVVIENWSYSTEDFQMYERRMRELGVEMPDE